MSSTFAFDESWFRPARRGRAARTERAERTHPTEHREHREHPGRGRGRFERGAPGGPGGPGFGPGGPFGFGGPGGPFGPFGPGRGRRGSRARRGDIRAAALVLIAEEPRNGYQIIQALADRSDGAWRASPGSVYPALQQLEDEGLITATTDDGQRRWQLTAAGRTYVEENREKLGAPWESVGAAVPSGARELAELGLQVGSALHQVVRAGNDAQIAQAAKILKDTRRSLYRILAEDDENPT